jgi:hypothetical protein
MQERSTPQEKRPEPEVSKLDLGRASAKHRSRTDPLEGAPPAKRAMKLAALADGKMPGLTPASGKVLAEAAAICLEDRKHPPGVLLPRSGLMREELHLEWPPVDEQCRRSHADLQEATERGACGIAILIIQEVTGLVVVERSKKGTGFDYWLAQSDGPLFEATCRLEVSGLLTGTKTQVETRLRQKKAQMKPTDGLAPGIVAVIEFGTPIACVESK